MCRRVWDWISWKGGKICEDTSDGEFIYSQRGFEETAKVSGRIIPSHRIPDPFLWKKGETWHFQGVSISLHPFHVPKTWWLGETEANNRITPRYSWYVVYLFSKQYEYNKVVWRLVVRSTPKYAVTHRLHRVARRRIHLLIFYEAEDEHQKIYWIRNSCIRWSYDTSDVEELLPINPRLWNEEFLSLPRQQ